MAFDSSTFPIGFRTGRGRLRSGLLTTSGPVRDAFVVEARQSEGHLKEAVVHEGGHGSTWRLASDEGTALGGSDLAPTPLMFFNAGLQADLSGRVARLARDRKLSIGRFGTGISARYALTGAFADGSGQGFAEAVGGHVTFEADVPDWMLAKVVSDAVAQSPAFDLVTRPLVNTFALYCNGRRRYAPDLPASGAAAPVDPFLKYAKAPAPIDNQPVIPDIVSKTVSRAGPGSAFETSGETSGGRVVWAVNGEGEYDEAAGLYRATAALDRVGSTAFAFVTDESAADRAPSGLALISAAVAFCYMTQLTRFILAMKLGIGGPRLVQTAPCEIVPDGAGRAAPFDTHLFLQGTADEGTFEALQRMAANTCYLHQTMAAATPLKVTATNRGRVIL